MREKLLPVDEALEIVLRSVAPGETELTGISGAFGRTLAEDVRAEVDIPAFDNSAMDGYAIIAADTRGASAEQPVRLEVIGESAAGRPAGVRVRPGTAVRIMTGGVMPDGADGIVMVEDTRAEEGSVLILAEAEPGRHVRQAGEDVRKGETVLRAGSVIRAAEMGMLAALGKPGIPVYRRPRAAVVTTGDELVDVTDELPKGKVRNSNRYSLIGQLLAAGCEIGPILHASDDPGAIEEAVSNALAADAVVTTGGASVGRYDYLREALERIGRVLFWRVAMKPGKPTGFALARGKPVFALPGNPVSTMVPFEVFARPALLAMQGRAEIRRPHVTAVLTDDVEPDARRQFVRAVTRWESGRYFTATTGPQGSGILRSMVLANSLAVIPENRPAPRAGDDVEVMLLRD